MNQYKQIQKQVEKEKDARQERCIPIAHFILEKFVASGISLKVCAFEEVMTTYKPVYEEIIKEGLDKGWLINDIIYSVGYFQRLTENLKNVIDLSLSDHQEKAVNKALGKELTKLTLQDVDELLKK
jgi:hypothetical protein